VTSTEYGRRDDGGGSGVVSCCGRWFSLLSFVGEFCSFLSLLRKSLRSKALLLFFGFFEWVGFDGVEGVSVLPRFGETRSRRVPEMSKLPRTGDVGTVAGSSFLDRSEESDIEENDFLCKRFRLSSSTNGAEGGSRSRGGSRDAEVSRGGSCGAPFALNM